MTLERLKQLLAGEPSYRVRQAARAIFRSGASSFDGLTVLPAALRGRLRGARVLCLEPESLRSSADGRAHKALLRLADGRRVESVLMAPKPGHWSVCVSSQVGCALRCSFCATGLMGFIRDLSAEEITDQVLFWRSKLEALAGKGSELASVVYMGMGEPFLNIGAVFESLRRLSDPEQFGLGARRLSVSTAGVLPGVSRFAREFPQVNLALSLHAANDELRARLVPLNKAYPLAAVRRALGEYFRLNRRKVFLEYVLLAGENDRPKDARALAAFAREAGPPGLLHVNLIVWNPTDTAHASTPREQAGRFAAALKAAGVPVTLRRNLGLDIDGACGQLAVREA